MTRFGPTSADDLAPELRIVLNPPGLDPGEPVRRPSSWADFVATVERERLVGLAWARVRDGSVSCTDRDRDDLRRRWHRSIGQSLQRDAILVEVLELFDAAGIESRLIKGIGAGFGLYDDRADRQTGDIDLLVPPSALSGAAELLGRRLGTIRKAHRGSIDRAVAKAIVIVTPAGVEIDLHQRLGLSSIWAHPALDQFATAGAAIEIEGTPALGATPASLMVGALAHAVSRVCRLSTVADLARGFHCPEHEAALGEALEIMEEAGLAPVARRALAVAAPATPIPPAVQGRVDAMRCAARRQARLHVELNRMRVQQLTASTTTSRRLDPLRHAFEMVFPDRHWLEYTGRNRRAQLAAIPRAAARQILGSTAPRSPAAGGVPVTGHQPTGDSS